ncbi:MULTISPECIES: SDR family oxidoreductase [Polyangium]|uniref:SDR family oxidoreductase n=2 Tax=Polyangium TaxID=55 RepID=A0A4U1IV97_9BACT|nr:MULTISPECIES: SDR family oxidoreductase [Polyangium]MDI1435840.1 SDR family oxidoreductase [Polyangium sorediatum]TKC98324.1 SDR family oxidoreductase [Polyangium fumosum]
MGKLQNKVVLVTGGTTGIGLAAARLFAAEGAKVTVTGSNPQTIEAARKELSGIAEVVASDAGSSADIAALAARFAAEGKGVDVLFLNAGVAKFGPITSLDEAAFDDSFRINVRGPWLYIKHFAPILRRGGAIVVNSSINNQLGMPGSSVYAASKAAVRSIVRVAAAELAEAGIRVNAVSPGPIETPLHTKLGFPEEARKGFAQGLIAQIPMRRFGTADEVAKAALFLASDDASFMTGEEIVLDGGMTRV